MPGLIISLLLALCAADGTGSYPIEPAPFTAVTFDDAFWKPRLETNRTVTVPYDFRKCEETGRIDNFARAGGLMDGEFEGIFFNDSDVFKVVEGASYSLALHPDPELDAYLDALIAKFAAAQEEDGYLYTVRTIDPSTVPAASGPERWSNTRVGHELYNVGHMYEAAAAHFRATGKRNLLDVALKNADLIAATFGPGKRLDIPGHQEIEIGLCKLYHVTGKKKYLDLAKFFLDERGRARDRTLYGPYCQDHEPVVEQSEAVGHAVRAGYMYSGMADVAALAGDSAYIDAIGRIWKNVTERKLYLTGGIGARHAGEAFGDDFELPNGSAYNETCAAIANAMWNHRLFLLHGDGKYVDVLERIIYNGFLSGVGLSGDAFFYPNPLASRGKEKRAPWFGCSCCPTNVVRFLPSLPGYAFATRDDAIFVNLYVGGKARIDCNGRPVELVTKTGYPWDGTVKITVGVEEPAPLEIRLRIPGWARNVPAPGGLYRYLNASDRKPALAVNGEKVPVALEKGFASIRRNWKADDTITLHLPMPVRRVLCDERVEANRGRVALERGPIVYCAEWCDNGGRVRDIFLPDDVHISAIHDSGTPADATRLVGVTNAVVDDGSGETVLRVHEFCAIPYHLWAHRGQGEMTVWLPRDPELAVPFKVRTPTVASKSRATASHTFGHDTVRALNDQEEPASSIDHDIPRHTFWDHRGTREWVQYDFSEATTVSKVAVYWFDDTGRGACRVPKAWNLLYRDGDAWKPVRPSGAFGVERDRYNEVSFEPVATTALHINVTLQENFSGGILEWIVE